MYCLRKKAVIVNRLMKVSLLFARLIDRLYTTTSSLHRAQLQGGWEQQDMNPKSIWRKGLLILL